MKRYISKQGEIVDCRNNDLFIVDIPLDQATITKSGSDLIMELPAGRKITFQSFSRKRVVFEVDDRILEPDDFLASLKAGNATLSATIEVETSHIFDESQSSASQVPAPFFHDTAAQDMSASQAESMFPEPMLSALSEPVAHSEENEPVVDAEPEEPVINDMEEDVFLATPEDEELYEKYFLSHIDDDFEPDFNNDDTPFASQEDDELYAGIIYTKQCMDNSNTTTLY